LKTAAWPLSLGAADYLLLVVEVDDIGAAGFGAHALKPIAATARVIMAMILMY
jgi:hypothetical protein